MNLVFYPGSTLTTLFISETCHAAKERYVIMITQKITLSTIKMSLAAAQRTENGFLSVGAGKRLL